MQKRFEVGTELLAVLLNGLGGLNSVTVAYNGDGSVNTITDNESGVVTTLAYSMGQIVSASDGVNTWSIVRNGANQITDITVT